MSLPHDSFYRLVEEVRTRVGSLGNTTGYGHIGDSNIHINVTVPQNDNIDTVKAVLEPFIYEYLHSVKGSISAEHGIGLMKPNKLHYSKSTEMIDYMQRIKKMFDPEGIMNPYKVIPN